MSIRAKAAAMILAAALAGPGLAVQAGRVSADTSRHVHGVGQLDIAIDGSEVKIALSAPAVTLVGFEHAPQSDMESETLRLARENLKSGDAMIRFNTNAACRLIKARVDSDLPEATPAEDPAAQAHADITAYYRFECLQPQALDSAALGLFTGFPALQRVLVRYEMPEGRGAAELTRGNPLVSFIPF